MKRIEDKKTLRLRPLEIDRKYLLKVSSTLVICYRALVKLGSTGLVSFQTVALFVQSFYLVWFI